MEDFGKRLANAMAMVESGEIKLYDPSLRPSGNNATEWSLFLQEWPESPSFVAVQIAEAIDEAVERAVDRMGWPEIRAFQDEMRKGQDVYEDAGGYFMRGLKRLFGIKTGRTEIETYQAATMRMVEEARRG